MSYFSLTLRLFFIVNLFVFSLQSDASDEGSLNVDIPYGYQLFSLPFPQKKLPVNSTMSVYINNKLIPAKITFSLLWPKKHSTNSVRVLNIELENLPIDARSMTLTWQHADHSLIESSAVSKIDAKLIYPNKHWLRETLLLTSNRGVDEHWYRHIQELMAIYLANEKLLAKNKYPRNVASQWLYDRAQVFYQLYLSGNKNQYKRQADLFVVFYKSQINENGFFKLSKPKDIKYLMGRSLVYDYLLNQNISSLTTLKTMFQASLSWNGSYGGRGFWTERHHAAALNIAISYWELTGSEAANNRIKELISGVFLMTFKPINGWSIRNCPQHTFKSHEGWGDSSPTCSPWMMALLADNLWRYYLLTGDESSAKLLSAFSDFMLKEATYIANEGKIVGHLIPKYIVSLDNPKQEELEPWSDREHMCDVAAMIGKGVIIKKERGNKYFSVNQLFKKMSEQCKAAKLAVIEKYKYVKLTHLRSKPPRKFNWQYSSTDDLPWLMHTLNGSGIE